MENYESLGTIGEGTYGVVLKCRHKTTGQIVAIKKFKESDDDEQVKKTALREIKILKQLKHENIVSLLEVFRVKGKLYLVFEYVEKTILEEIEKNPEGLDPLHIKRLMWQLVRAIHFCHQHNIIHRDIKPENLLVSRNGVLKLCDFGFARPLAGAGAKYTEYVSTRWYRAPELLVGDVSYGKAVDVWSIGCMFAETATGLPLFPGDSDIDQLYHIIKCLGSITPRQQELFKKNALYVGVKLPHATEREPLEARFPQFDKHSLDLLKQTVKDEPLDRWTCAELLNHPYFDNSSELFEKELQDAIQRDLNDTMSLRKKRTRSQKPPPSRGAAVHGLSADEYGDSYYSNPPSQIQGPKPTFKPMASVAKEKPHVVMPKKPALGVHGYGGGHGGGGGLVLPTLSSSMTPSSSTTSTVSIDSTIPTATTTPSLLQNPAKKPGAVLPMPLSESHIEANSYYQNAPRVSLTSHGARPTIPATTLYQSPAQPQSPFHAMPQRPPPTSHGKSGNSTPKGSKNSRVFPAGSLKPSHKVVATSSLQSSMEIYSPAKKAATHNSNSSYGSPLYTAAKKANAAPSTISPLSHGVQSGDYGHDMGGGGGGYYAPPKTSHGGAARRAQAAVATPPAVLVGGGVASKQRRTGAAENDSYRNY